MENGEWRAKAEAQDLRLSPTSGGGKPDVAERRAASQWPCLPQGCPWGLGLDDG